MCPPRDRRTHHNVALAAPARQHHIECRQQHHEQRRALRTRKLVEPCRQLRRHCKAVICTPIARHRRPDRKSTRLNSSHSSISYAVFCLKKKKQPQLSLVLKKKKKKKEKPK